MRLLLLPVLYNAMAQSEDPRHHVLSPLFRAMHAAIHASTYSPLVVATAQGICHSAFPAQQQAPVFHGPHSPLQCLAKYTVEDQSASKPKRKRSKGSPAAAAAAAAPPEASDATVRGADAVISAASLLSIAALLQQCCHTTGASLGESHASLLGLG